MSLFALSVDLTGSNLGPEFRAVELLMETDAPDGLRRLAAAHYEIPLEQVAEPVPSTEQEFERGA